jgi:two-component system CheB/CheR fusion protein
MPVAIAEDGAALKPNHVYVPPAGCELRVRSGRLVCDTQASSQVDGFFESLAKSEGHRAVAVVLSGADAVGAAGVRAIKLEGGHVLVQDPRTAREAAMPMTALATGMVDAVAGPAELGPHLAGLLTARSDPTARDHLSEDSTQAVVGLVREKTGSDFSHYKAKTLERRIRRRMALHHVTRIAEYVRILASSPTEAELLRREMMISVTGFFRDREAWDALREALDLLVASKEAGAMLRIWVPGCATGEEAYSIAMLVGEAQRTHGKNLVVQIFATDIDEEAVRSARVGLYPKERLAGLDEALVSRYFHPVDDKLRPAKSLREQIIFASQDLLGDPPFSRLDLISCRNLLIYFDGELQSRIIPLFHYALAPHGLLFLGKSETIGKYTELFRPLGRNKKWKVYQRLDTLTPQRLVLPRPAQRAVSSGVPQVLPRGDVRLDELTDHEIVTALGVRAAVVDENLDVVFVRGDLRPYQGPTDGLRGLQVLDFVRKELRAGLRSLIRRVQRERASADSGPIRLEDAGSARSVRMVGRPLATGSKTLTLVLFRDEAIHEEQPAVALDDVHEARIAALEQELEAAREHLQSTVDELESSNIELQSLNEELQSANEELQSTNEELETSNEELQATNEELTTVNDELHTKTVELGHANDDLENVIRRIGIGVVLTDGSLRVRRFNPPAKLLFDLEDESRGEPLTEVSGRVDVGALALALRQVIETGQLHSSELAVGNRWYEMRIFPFYSYGGEIEGALLTFVDTTEVRRREVAFRTLADNAPDVVMRFDRQLRHVYVNPRVESYTDLSPEVIVGKTHRELGFPESLCDQVERGVSHVYQEGREATFELELESPDGASVCFEARVVPERQLDGSVDTVLALARDITQRKRSEDKLREQEERWRAFFSQRVVAMAIGSPSREIVEVNDRLCEILGYARHELVGTSWVGLAHPDDSEKGVASFERLLRGEIDGYSMEKRLVRKDGEVRELLLSVAAVRDAAGRVRYIVAMGLDRTEQRRVERQSMRLEDELRQIQKMEAVGTLAGGVAHEFNNVLATITGLADLMLSDPRALPIFEPELEEIIRASERGKSLVRQILTFSRKSSRHLRRVDLNEEVRHASALLEHTLPKMIRIELELEDGLPGILGDSNQIEQILVSLATNARDAMENVGELTFRTTLTTVPPKSRNPRHLSLRPGKYVELQVSDTGQGIPKSVLPRIFEPFFTTKPVGAGTGLGLSTAYGIVKSHHGAITCESVEGCGTTFYVLLPIDDTGLFDGPTGEPETESELPSIEGGHEKVLIVDDEPVLLRSLELHLERKGYAVRTALTGEEALDTLLRMTRPVDVIVLDINMPGMGGFQALDQMKAVRPELRIIVASGQVPDATMRRLPVDFWLQKPFRVDALLRALRTVLDGAPAALPE